MKKDLLPLVGQSDISATITQGAIPVLTYQQGTVSSRHIALLIAQTVNFLRAGCPKVQILFSSTYSGEKDTEHMVKFERFFRELLIRLQEPGELLSLRMSERTLDGEVYEFTAHRDREIAPPK